MSIEAVFGWGPLVRLNQDDNWEDTFFRPFTERVAANLRRPKRKSGLLPDLMGWFNFNAFRGGFNGASPP